MRTASEPRSASPRSSGQSQKRRIPYSFLKRNPKTWSPPGFEWSSLEAILGKTLTGEERAAVKRAVDRYFKRASIERTAPYVSDLAQRLRKASKCAEQLKACIEPLGLEMFSIAPHWLKHFPDEEVQGPSEEVTDEAEQGIFDAIWQEFSPRHLDPRRFRDVVSAISETLCDTVDDLTRDGATNFLAGDAWTQLFAELALELRSHGFTPTSANDPNRPLSQFAVFVRELQNTFDAEFQLHHDDAGLRKAVSAAIRRSKSEGFKLADTNA